MPIISMFYGIIVQLFFFDNEKHHKPHIHVRYSEFKASIDIETARNIGRKITSTPTAISVSLDRNPQG